MEQLKKRKTIRLNGADYNGEGAYFLTICTQNRKCSLSRIVDDSHVELLRYGKIAQKNIEQLNAFYKDITVESYVIMPNHIHLMLSLHPNADTDGPSGTPVPTIQNSVISRFVSTFKRFCNKECGKNIWQARFYDHIIRNQKDYEQHINYIYENPMRWCFDEMYCEDL